MAARTLQQIHDELKANFVANTVLQSMYGFTPGNTFEQEFSIVSFEGALLYIVAFSIWILESNFDELEQRINEKITNARKWSLPNFVADAYAFQYGDSLIYSNREYKYATDNPSSKIIKVASATEVGNSVVLKVATESGGSYGELSPTQMTAFADYITLMKPPGYNLLIVSRPADLLKIFAHIYVNPQVINTSGELISNPSVRPVDDAINAYCIGLDFNGVYDLTKLTDLLQQVPGVVRPVIDSAHAKFGTLPYEQIVDVYTPNSGYLKIDPAFPLDGTGGTITYLT
jgi:hypothetical protein